MLSNFKLDSTTSPPLKVYLISAIQGALSRKDATETNRGRVHHEKVTSPQMRPDRLTILNEAVKTSREGTAADSSTKRLRNDASPGDLMVKAHERIMEAMQQVEREVESVLRMIDDEEPGTLSDFSGDYMEAISKEETIQKILTQAMDAANREVANLVEIQKTALESVLRGQRDQLKDVLGG